MEPSHSPLQGPMLVSHYELLNISLAVIDTMKVPESPIWLAGTKIDGEPHPISDQTEKQGLVVHCRFTHTLPSQGEVLVAGTPWCGKKKTRRGLVVHRRT
jgi:hypothetical protein